MAKRRRRYSRSASSDVKSEMHRYKRGTAKSGRGGKGGRVKSRKQAIAIGLSQGRKKGKKVPKKKESVAFKLSDDPVRRLGSHAPRWQADRARTVRSSSGRGLLSQRFDGSSAGALQQSCRYGTPLTTRPRRSGIRGKNDGGVDLCWLQSIDRRGSFRV